MKNQKAERNKNSLEKLKGFMPNETEEANEKKLESEEEYGQH